MAVTSSIFIVNKVILSLQYVQITVKLIASLLIFLIPIFRITSNNNFCIFLCSEVIMISNFHSHFRVDYFIFFKNQNSHVICFSLIAIKFKIRFMNANLNDSDKFFWLIFSFRLNKYVIWRDV